MGYHSLQAICIQFEYANQGHKHYVCAFSCVLKYTKNKNYEVKIMKIIKIIAIMLAFALCIGSIGALEQGNITTLRCLAQCAISTVVAFFVLKTMEDC